MSKFMLLSFRTHPQPLPITPKNGVTRRGASKQIHKLKKVKLV